MRAKSSWENKHSVAVTGESLSHSSLLPGQFIPLHTEWGWGDGAKTQMTWYFLMPGSYVIYTQVNGLQSYWDRQDIKH